MAIFNGLWNPKCSDPLPAQSSFPSQPFFPAATLEQPPAVATALSVKEDNCGKASWYGPGFHGKQTANQEIFDQTAMTAAHKTLPFNTRIRVTDISTGYSIAVRVNDRGPFKPGRIIDLSQRAAEILGIDDQGVAPVCFEVL